MVRFRSFRRALLVAAAAMVCVPAFAAGDVAPASDAVQAPGFELPLLDGGDIALRELRGRVVLLDFWASWCVPCRLSLPALQLLQTEYTGKPVVVLPVSVDEDPDDARRFLARFAKGLPSALDADGEVAALYELQGMPSSFLIDPHGGVRMVHAGYRKGDIGRFRAAIDALLAERSGSQ